MDHIKDKSGLIRKENSFLLYNKNYYSENEFHKSNTKDSNQNSFYEVGKDQNLKYVSRNNPQLNRSDENVKDLYSCSSLNKATDNNENKYSNIENMNIQIIRGI